MIMFILGTDGNNTYKHKLWHWNIIKSKKLNSLKKKEDLFKFLIWWLCVTKELRLVQLFSVSTTNHHMKGFSPYSKLQIPSL